MFVKQILFSSHKCATWSELQYDIINIYIYKAMPTEGPVFEDVQNVWKILSIINLGKDTKKLHLTPDQVIPLLFCVT